MNRTSRAALALALMALGPVACSSEPEEAEPAGPEAAPAAADPDAPDGISVSGGRLTLPAVSGNPGAVYFTIANDGDADLAIRSAWVEGAERAMLHQSVETQGQVRMQGVSEVPLSSGEDVAFAPGGLHVMAMGLDESIEQGGETEVTLTFAGGDKVSFPAEIVAAGDLGEAD